MASFNDIQAIILDIEGTTTPITFVHDVLFPFAKSNLRHHLNVNWEEEETQNDVSELAKQAQLDATGDSSSPYFTAPQIELKSGATKDNLIDQVVANVEFNMNLDRKMTALKQLQGHIWKFGFKSGNIVGQVYDDVVPQLDQWKKSGKQIYIYSSGSVFAQKLLFGHSNQQYQVDSSSVASNDLTVLLNGHFDTVHPGSKLEAKSYQIIAQDIQTQPENILFATDNIQEADAAKEAGWNVILSVRPGTAELPAEHPYQTVTSFDQISLNSVKH